MVPVRDKSPFDPQPWDGTENKLPGVCENGGYYLKDGAAYKGVAVPQVGEPVAWDTNKLKGLEMELSFFV